MPGPEATRAGFTGGATGPFVSPTGPSPEGQMWVQMDSEQVPDSYMHHAYKFAKTHSSGLKQTRVDSPVFIALIAAFLTAAVTQPPPNQPSAKSPLGKPYSTS